MQTDIYLNTYGTYLHVKDQMFAIQTPIDGKKTTNYVAAHKIRSIIITTQAALSTEAVKLALSKNIDILFVEGEGDVLGRIWHSKLGSTTQIRKEQLVASLNHIGLEWVKFWLTTKLQNQADFLIELRKHRSEKYGDYLQDKAERIITQQQSINDAQAETVAEVADSFRGWEGTAGRLYFQSLNHILPEQYQFDGRSRQPAQDPFNAFLNYAYGIMYSKVEKTLIIAGLEPYLGFMHADGYNKKSLVYDYIEPYRIYAEKVVFKLFSAKKVNKAHTDQITNGYTLNKEGKQLLIQAFTKYVSEDKIRYKNRNQSRLNIMQQEAHHFANSLLPKAKTAAS